MRRASVALLWTLVACADRPSPPGDGGTLAPDDGGAVQRLTKEQLRDPETCKGCHPGHFREWSSSMHAYAAKDPVFIAMNARGQRETGGALGDFCVRCHAPMAVIDGLTTDGLNLDELPDRDRGVSCYFCHNLVAIEGDHNAQLRIADDTTMRGTIRDPVQPTAHRAEHSELLVHTNRSASAICGGCHDIVTPNGVHLERTFAEYQQSISAMSAEPGGPPFDACQSCHMPERRAAAAVYPGAGERSVHEHLWPGIDVALTDFPNRDALESAVEDCQLGQASITFFTLEVSEPDVFTFRLETNAGHNQPSGSAQDRRMWLEVLAYDAAGQIIEEVSSGNIGPLEVEEKPASDPLHDPQLWLFRDRIFNAAGDPVHMFWEAASSEAYPDGYSSSTLPARTTLALGANAVERSYRMSTAAGLPARVTARLRIRPIGMDVLHDLVDSGDLDRTHLEAMPTFTFGAQLEWFSSDGFTTLTASPTTDCEKYRCLLHPGSEACD